MSAALQHVVLEDGSCINRLRDIIQTPHSFAILSLELWTVHLCAEILVKATYDLEGDSCTSLIAHEVIMGINQWFSTHLDDLTFPLLASKIDMCANSLNIPLADVQQRVRGILEEGFEYFKKKVLQV